MINGGSMTVPIEDTIIAYLDGHLNDTEGAELLHRVSVSPEIRQIFQEHEALRQVAFRAARNAAVPTELEESVFARVAALENSRDRGLPVGFWSMPRISAMIGTVAIIALALLAPWRAGETNLNSNHRVIAASQPAAPVGIAQATSNLNAGSPTASLPTESSNTTTHRNAVRESHSASNVSTLADNLPAAQPPQSISDPVIQIIPKPDESDRINIPTVGNSPQTL
jgi:anti-sigma factor RsiW